MTQLTQVDTASRNTNSRARSYCFTYNNYPSDALTQLTQYFGDAQYVIGIETGKENGTPHLQGAVKFENARAFSTLKKAWPQIHWEITKNWNASVKYCKKEGNYRTNITEEGQEPSLDDLYNNFMEVEYKDVEWRPWQKDVLDIISGPVDRRKIHWFWESTGNSGKSFLTKYIEWKHPTVIVNGKQGDVFNGIKSFLEQKKKYPNPVIIDIPRVNENYVCYGTMEKIKDGLFYSGKYEGGVIRLLPCHLIVFANFPPELHKMSADRWDVHNISVLPADAGPTWGLNSG